MLCEWCGKNPGIIQFASIINDQKNVVYICDKCAREKGLVLGSHFSLADLLASMTDVESMTQSGKQKFKCQKCNLSYTDFKKTGRFGCSECYKAFEESLLPMLKRIQGNTRHIGKVPKGAYIEKEKSSKVKEESGKIKGLKKRLQTAIKKEEFEKAAELRDAIKAEEKKSK
jgi:protein arginine kinase activator